LLPEPNVELSWTFHWLVSTLVLLNSSSKTRVQIAPFVTAAGG
jgi:hypothetical protein